MGTGVCLADAECVGLGTDRAAPCMTPGVVSSPLIKTKSAICWRKQQQEETNELLDISIQHA